LFCEGFALLSGYEGVGDEGGMLLLRKYRTIPEAFLENGGVIIITTGVTNRIQVDSEQNSAVFYP
jgi:hypothetical protein